MTFSARRAGVPSDDNGTSLAAENAATFTNSNLAGAFGVDEILERSLIWRPSTGRVALCGLVDLICNQHLSERQQDTPHQ
jgi:hypothetical protein